MSQQPQRAFVEQLAREAGALLRRYATEGFTISYKAAINLVTTADHASEQFIVSRIRETFPAHSIISEEDDTLRARNADAAWVWYIDPIDGTTSFAHGYPAFAVSIALYERDEPRLAAIYDPSRDELFSAQQGAGAWLNGERIAVSQTQSLIASLLTSGFPYDVQETGGNLAAFEHLTLLSRGVRVSGSAALDLAWVACGRIDGYWEPVIAPWDGAAGALIVREAGGIASDYLAQAWQPATPSVIAANPRLYALLRDAVQSAPDETGD